MKTYGLIGYPLSQSFSQKYFTDKFQTESIEARYLNFPIESINDFTGLIKKHPYIAGLNATIPYKEQVMQYLDELSPDAADIKAVNVIKFDWSNKDKPRLIGHNSDVYGFSQSIKPLLKSHHTKALILGTGGAAKAVEYSLKKMEIEFKYVSRTAKDGVFSYADLNEALMQEYTLIINSTPLGMYPKIDGKPNIPYQFCNEKHLFYDLVYNPEVTQFLAEGKKNGAQIKNGLEMLHLQAAKAWEIWNE